MNNFRLRVVLYREDELWVAHSLEMDLIGVGTTQLEAIRELRGNVEAHVSFAKFSKSSPFRSAPPEILSLWDQSNLSALGIPNTGGNPGQESATRFMNWSSRQVSLIPETPYEFA